MTLIWIGFIALVLLMLALDLGVFHRHAHAVSVREALIWTAVWIATALLFNVAVYFLYANHVFGFGRGPDGEVVLSGGHAALEFFTGYLIEKSLSLDNIFVIALIFGYFGVESRYQHRVLFWGILGALIMRGIMIGAGVAMIRNFEWIIYVFGGLLIATAAKMLMSGETKIEPERSLAVRAARRLIPVASNYHGEHFFVRIEGRHMATPLLIVLIVIESTDVLFAIDSIPAIFAVTRDPFIVFTSNVFAILGLRALYFALAGMIERFRYLRQSLVALLAYVGVKMLLSHVYPIPTPVSLAVIAGILAVGVVASIIAAKRRPLPEAERTVAGAPDNQA
jgi:tellurite resistance protein TerC